MNRFTVFKATDSNYMDWLYEIEDSKTLDRMLYIFGHSIGITDKDIIGPFIKSQRYEIGAVLP